MANGIQTANGKAFEYACVLSVCHELSLTQKVEIEDSQQIRTAASLYESMNSEMRMALDCAAMAGIRVIRRLEPQLWELDGNEPLFVSVQSDSAGIAGDVRDVLCVRKQNGWQIGFSCKHNHHAVKHSRLSDKIDSRKYWRMDHVPKGCVTANNDRT